MDQAELEERVKKVIANVLKIKPEEIPGNANFVFDLGADSLQSVQLVAAFEEEFDITMEEDKALEIQTVADAVVFIGSHFPS